MPLENKFVTGDNFNLHSDLAVKRSEPAPIATIVRTSLQSRTVIDREHSFSNASPLQVFRKITLNEKRHLKAKPLRH